MAAVRAGPGPGPEGCRAENRWSAIGAAALGSAKLADVVTTVVGLVFFGAIEANPVGRSLIAHLGLVPGLVLGSVVVVVFIVAVTERGVAAVRRTETDPVWPSLVRSVGYGVPTLLFAGVAVYNAALILSTV